MYLSPSTQSKICVYIHFHLLVLLPIIEGGGYGFGDKDVLFQKVVSGLLLTGLWAVVHEVSDFLAVVALLSFRLCLL